MMPHPDVDMRTDRTYLSRLPGGRFEHGRRPLFCAREEDVEQALLIIKPDAVARNAIGDILKRLETEGFAIRELRMVHLTTARAEAFYAVHRGKPFYRGLVEFMTSGPVVPVVLEREQAVPHLRGFIGATDSTQAAAGTIRRAFGTDVQRNAVHASDSPENAVQEIDFFFGD